MTRLKTKHEDNYLNTDRTTSMHIYLFNDLLNVDTLSFMHNVYYSNVYHIINDFFVRLPSVHSYSTRSKSYNFYLNHAVNNSFKNFYYFSWCCFME